MKIIKMLVLIALFALLGCQQTGGYQIIKGKKAKKEITKKTDIVFATGFWFVFNSYIKTSCSEATSSSNITAPSSLSSYVQANFIGSIIGDALSGIEDKKNYTQESLDKCLNKIEISYPLATAYASQLMVNGICSGTLPPPGLSEIIQGLSCKLEEAATIQLGKYGAL